MSDNKEITSTAMRHLAEQNIRRDLMDKKITEFLREIKHNAERGETEVVVPTTDLRSAEQRFIRKNIESRGFKVFVFASEWTITW